MVGRKYLVGSETDGRLFRFLDLDGAVKALLVGPVGMVLGGTTASPGRDFPTHVLLATDCAISCDETLFSCGFRSPLTPFYYGYDSV